MTLPILTNELANRFDDVETEACTSRLEAILQREGNPLGVEICRFGNATAYYVAAVDSGMWNCVKGLRPEDARFVGEIAEFYRERGRPVRAETIPSATSHELCAALAKNGLCPVGFGVQLYGVARAADFGCPPGVAVRPIQADEFDTFGHIHCLGAGIPPEFKHEVGRNNQVLLANPAWSIYLVTVDDVPAAIGVVYCGDTIATLTLAATLPSHRGLGAQTALIYERISRAAEAGCEIAIGQTEFGSISMRNMQRAGMRVAYTKVSWSSADVR